MKVTISSTLGSIPKEVKNEFYVENLSSIDALLKMVVTDKVASLKRQDGKEIFIVNNGCIYTEVYNQKQLLVDWCNLKVDEFPEAGEYAKSSI